MREMFSEKNAYDFGEVDQGVTDLTCQAPTHDLVRGDTVLFGF